MQGTCTKLTLQHTLKTRVQSPYPSHKELPQQSLALCSPDLALSTHTRALGGVAGSVRRFPPIIGLLGRGGGGGVDTPRIMNGRVWAPSPPRHHFSGAQNGPI
jgi:hypothetical protein